MPRGLIGKKMGMTQVFTGDGTLIPATLVLAGPCAVVQVKTKEKDGYDALQLGFMKKKPQRANRPIQGHCKSSGSGPFYVLREFPTENAAAYQPGQEVTVTTVFEVGDFIDVTGSSKGRGFTGVIKRHGFRGAPGSHGTHEYFRHGGSIGSSAFPSRTIKGKRMPGQHGNRRTTVQNLQILDIKADDNLLVIKGSVPGPANSVLMIRHARKKAGEEFPLEDA